MVCSTSGLRQRRVQPDGHDSPCINGMLEDFNGDLDAAEGRARGGENEKNLRGSKKETRRRGKNEETKRESKMKVLVRRMDGSEFVCVEAHCDTRMGDVRKAAETAVPGFKVHLLHGDHKCSDDALAIGDLKLVDGAELTGHVWEEATLADAGFWIPERKTIIAVKISGYPSGKNERMPSKYAAGVAGVAAQAVHPGHVGSSLRSVQCMVRAMLVFVCTARSVCSGFEWW